MQNLRHLTGMYNVLYTSSEIVVSPSAMRTSELYVAGEIYGSKSFQKL